MNEEPTPGTSTEDQTLIRHWRERSAEEPSSATDNRILAAARASVSTSPRAARGVRSDSRWSRWVPLAAAASVALLAVGLVRLMPSEEYQAIPTPQETRATAPEATRTEHVPESYPAAHPPGRDFAVEGRRAPEPAPPSERRAALAASPPTDAVAAEERGEVSDRGATADASESVERTSKSSNAPAPDAVTHPAETARTVAPAASPALSHAARRADSSGSLAMPAELAAQVRSDAAQRTGLTPGSIRIVAVDPVTWLDESLGCEAARAPAPEARVSGYVVTVSADGKLLRYHTDAQDRIRVCDDE